MSKQKHDLGVIKKKTGQARKDKEIVWRERRKRSLPWLYPGWNEDKRPIATVLAELKWKREKAKLGTAPTEVTPEVENLDATAETIV